MQPFNYVIRFPSRLEGYTILTPIISTSQSKSFCDSIHQTRDYFFFFFFFFFFHTLCFSFVLFPFLRTFFLINVTGEKGGEQERRIRKSIVDSRPPRLHCAIVLSIFPEEVTESFGNTFDFLKQQEAGRKRTILYSYITWKEHIRVGSNFFIWK